MARKKLEVSQINNPAQAVEEANATKTNDPYMCQNVTRGWFNAPSAGDQDNDGDFDAFDGWQSEPAEARHPGDRRPPAGYPMSWSGGSKGHGHRAISLGNGQVRSTDVPRLGVVGNVDIDWFERNWGLSYLGWSETIDGERIPHNPRPNPEESMKEPRADTKLGKALANLRSARRHAQSKGHAERVRELTASIRKLLEAYNAKG
jgi:hypothetical protein